MKYNEAEALLVKALSEQVAQQPWWSGIGLAEIKASVAKVLRKSPGVKQAARAMRDETVPR